jgi:hypothetical protein
MAGLGTRICFWTALDKSGGKVFHEATVDGETLLPDVAYAYSLHLGRWDKLLDEKMEYAGSSWLQLRDELSQLNQASWEKTLAGGSS